MEQIVLYTQRKRAKDASIGLSKLSEEIELEVAVTDDGYFLRIVADDDLEDGISGLVILGTKVSEKLWPEGDECREFYSGTGLSRFRGA